MTPAGRQGDVESQKSFSLLARLASLSELLPGTSSGFGRELPRHPPPTPVAAQTQLHILRVEMRSRIFGKLGSRNERKCLSVLLFFVCGYRGYSILPNHRVVTTLYVS